MKQSEWIKQVSKSKDSGESYVSEICKEWEKWTSSDKGKREDYTFLNWG